MAVIKAGDRVRIKDRPDWPLPEGYPLANVECKVFDVVDEPEGYFILVLSGKDVIGLDPRVPLCLRSNAVEKI